MGNPHCTICGGTGFVECLSEIKRGHNYKDCLHCNSLCEHGIHIDAYCKDCEITQLRAELNKYERANEELETIDRALKSELEQVKKERELERSGLMSAHQMMTSELNDKIDQLRTQRDKAVEALRKVLAIFDYFHENGTYGEGENEKVDKTLEDAFDVLVTVAEVKEPTQKPEEKEDE